MASDREGVRSDLQRLVTDILAAAPTTVSGEDLALEVLSIAKLLLEKNAAYGDSALNPVRVFSQADPIEQIKVRLDDKLSRLSRGSAGGEDVELDLLGYIVLLRIARRRAAETAG